jgi:hypothetical protein
MSIRLNWGSANVALAESIKVYRSDTSFAANALPAVLTTLAGSATSYDDSTVVRNKLYYYRVGMVRAGQELISDLLIIGHYPDTGPGPQKLLRGTWELGYFGTVAAVDLFTASALLTALGGSPGGTVATDAQLTLWHKFIRKGKILLIPNYRLVGSNLNWIQLYAAGLVYGVDGPGDAPGLATFASYTGPVNQLKLVTVGAYQYKVRCPSFSDQPTSELVTDPLKILGSEWFELMGRIGPTSGATSPQDKWSDQGAGTAVAATCSPNFQASAMNLVTDGSYYDTYTSQNMAAGVASRYTSFIPVLELIL